MALKKSQKSLKNWTKQKWRTKSGKPSTQGKKATGCLLYTSPSPRDGLLSRMPSSA